MSAWNNFKYLVYIKFNIYCQRILSELGENNTDIFDKVSLANFDEV